MKQINKFILSSLILCCLSACGGGGGSASTESNQSNAIVQALSGKVIDGLIEGATVCLDINNNGKCDASERTAVTSSTGEYSLDISGLDTIEVANAVLLVSIPETAKDADDNGLTFAQANRVPVAMMAPVDLTDPLNNTINPFTTLVTNEMMQSGLTGALATDWVRSKLGLGTTAKLNVDYTNANLVSNAARLAPVARQIFADMSMVLSQCIRGDLTGLYLLNEGARLRDLMNANPPDIAQITTYCNWIASATVSDHVHDQQEQYKALSKGDAVVLSNALAFNGWNMDSNSKTLARIARESDQVTTDIRAGISEFKDIGISASCALDSNCSSYGSYRVRTSMVTPYSFSTQGVFSVNDSYAIQEKNFHPQSISPQEYWELSESNWRSVSSEIQTDRATDGSYTVKGGMYGTQGVLVLPTAKRLDSESLNVSGLNRFRTDQTFQMGSTGYILSFQTSTKRYVLSGSELTDAYQGVLSNGLESLVAAYPSSTTPSWVNALQSRTGLLLTFTPTGSSAGTLSLRNPDVPNQVAMTGGSYELQTVNGQRILMLTEIPEAALKAVEITNPAALADYEKGIRPFFAVAPDGKVREGVYTPPSILRNTTLLLNRKALNAVLQALSLCQMSPTYANESCPN